MCIIFWQTNTDNYSLVLAANRDEFLARPTTTAAWHSFTPSSATTSALDELPASSARVLSGLDLTAGGTWLGLSIAPQAQSQADQQPQQTSPAPLLKFSTLTNFTETPVSSSTPQPSRGALVSSFLLSSPSTSAADYIAQLEPTVAQYAGFNLLCGELSQEKGFVMGYTTNRKPRPEVGAVGEAPGEVLGLSNSTLRDEPRWPKVEAGCGAVKQLLAENRARNGGDDELIDGLWSILSRSHPTPVSHRSHLRHTILIKPAYFTPKSMEMPDNPLPFPPPNPDLPPPPPEELHLPREEMGQEGKGGMWYGTRVQTVVLIERKEDGSGFRVVFVERDGYVLGEDGKPSWSGEEHRYQFEL